MAVLAKRNGNAHPATARRARTMPSTLDFFPDVFGVSRLLDAMISSTMAPERELAPFPAIDVTEKDGKYVVDAAVPGFGKDEISIEVAGNQITISGEHEATEDDSKRRYSEIRREAFTRTLTLPREVDPESAKATFEDGVVKIELQPTTPIGTKKVPIEAK